MYCEKYSARIPERTDVLRQRMRDKVSRPKWGTTAELRDHGCRDCAQGKRVRKGYRMTTEARKESRNHDIPETKKPKESEISAKISALSRDLEDAIRRVGELRKGCSEVINLCTEIQITGYEILADATTNPAKNGGAK